MRVRKFYLLLAVLAVLALALLPFALSAQTPRVSQLRTIVRDAACPPAVGWIARDTTYQFPTQARLAQHTVLTCVTPPHDTIIVVLPPKDSTPKPPSDTLPTPPVGSDIVRYWGGINYQKIKTGQWTGDATAGEPSVRVICLLTATGSFDPGVYPGQAKAGHKHAFYGNAGINPSSTPASLASSGNSTCMGGTANRTGYWVPCMLMDRGVEQCSDSAIVYYKVGYESDAANIKEIPAGLFFIGGDKTATSAQGYAVEWSCDSRYVGAGFIPDCNTDGTDKVELRIFFPACWNGKDLDSPDHRSHMAYPIFSNNTNGSKCPSTHPYQIPTITEIFRWKIPAGSNMATWRLTNETMTLSASSRGGYGAHADWMNGWDQSIFRTFVVNCLNARKDCQVGFLGDGRMLDYVP